MNESGSHSEYFEELCALAANGQISEGELLELSEHKRRCDRCTSLFEDYSDLVHNKLSLIDPHLGDAFTLSRLPAEDSTYRERFLTRARKEGLLVPSEVFPQTRQEKSILWPFPQLSYLRFAPLAVALILVVILGYNLRQSNERNKALVAELSTERAQSRWQAEVPATTAKESVTAGSQVSVKTEEPPEAPTPSTATDPALVQVRQDLADAESRARALQEQLKAATLELEASGAHLEELSGTRSQLAAKLAESERGIGQVQSELQGVRENRTRDLATIARQTTRIQELSEKLSTQSEVLDREISLLAAGRDIHDLMGARNLHVVDVHEYDSRGKEQKTFGRVFYTEGKSLIFYAFDLADRAPRRQNASFQVWGTREPSRTSPRSLGILYVDDQKQNRWVLRFQDPAVLKEIDSVFVTVEPSGGSSRPTTDKFLYAYLKAEANHP